MWVGIYLLPKGGSEEMLAHDFDEFKITTRGGGRFDLSVGGFETQPGAIALIKEEEPYRPRRISDDLVILVIWKK
jgi:hypothetical protein